MSYCTVEELRVATGTNYPDEDLQAMIAMGDREIDATLQAAGVYGSGPALNAASLNLAISKLLTRMRMDGTKTASTSLDGTISLSDDMDKAIAAYEERAWAMVDRYISYASPRRRHPMSRSDR